MLRSHNTRNQQLLKQLLREPANKTCADCKTSKNPRWALWNLGVFVCIRCLGIHRSMGTHISRVKSADLDSWTDVQAESMVRWGNARANAFWEHGLPQGYVPDALKIENFIRTKYDVKKWALHRGEPKPEDVGDVGGAATLVAPAAAAPTPAAPAAAAPVAPAVANPTPVAPAPNTLLDLDFGRASLTPAERPLPQLPPQLASVPPRTDLKQSILSLYLTPMTPQPAPVQAPVQQGFLQGFQQQAQPQAQPQALAFNDDLFKNVWN